MSDPFVRLEVLEEERVGDELLLLHPRTLEVKLLNETGAILWEALPTFPTAEALVDLLTEARPELGRDRCAEQVTNFLEGLLAAGLIERRVDSGTA